MLFKNVIMYNYNMYAPLTKYSRSTTNYCIAFIDENTLRTGFFRQGLLLQRGQGRAGASLIFCFSPPMAYL